VFIVLGDRQLPQQVDLAMDDLVHRRRRHFDPRERMADGVLEPRQQFAGRNAERIRDPAAVREQVRDHRNRMVTWLWKQNRAVQLQLLGHRRHFVDQRYPLARHHQPVGHDEALQPTRRSGWALWPALAAGVRLACVIRFPWSWAPR